MLRTKGNTYKRKRQEINEITAEIQTLKRTEELLREQVEQIKSRMVCFTKMFTLLHWLMYILLIFLRLSKNGNKDLKDSFRLKNV